MIDPSDQDANESDFEYVKDSDLPSDEIGEKESVPQSLPAETISNSYHHAAESCIQSQTIPDH